MTAQLREMQWPDIETLTSLEEQLFGRNAWSAASWWSELAGRPRRRYTVATDAGTIVGYAGIDCAGGTADIMTIAVAPGQQGRGLGRTLLDRLMVQARESGAEAILLEVSAENEIARNLYVRAGFEHIRTRRGYYRPGNVDAHIMRAHLIPHEVPPPHRHPTKFLPRFAPPNTSRGPATPPDTSRGPLTNARNLGEERP